MLEKLENEINETKNEVEQIREESASFLTKTDAYRGREKRAAHVGAAILAGIGLFGGGILLGNSDCGITGIFGNCQESGRKNAENIDRLNRFTSILTDYVVEFEENTNEKFFMVSNELSEIRKAQKEMNENQAKNWKIMQEQFVVFEKNFHILRDCTQMLFSNQQLNFNFDTVSSLLSTLYADTKLQSSSICVQSKFTQLNSYFTQ